MCLEAPRPAQPCAEDTVLILYDTETTGLGRTDKVRIVELGAVAAIYKDDDGWVPIAEFQRYVALPGGGPAAIDPSVPHTITAHVLRNARPFLEDCGPAFAGFIQKHAGSRATVVVGHNAKRYDHRLLVFHGWKPPSVPSTAGLRFADSLDWLRKTHPKHQSYSIKNLFASFFEEPVPAAHSAVPDCYAMMRLINHEPRVQPDTALSLSERWANIRGRCLKNSGHRGKLEPAK